MLQSLDCIYGDIYIYIHTKQILYLYWFICNQWIYRISIFHTDFKLPLLDMEFMDQMKVSLTLMNLLDPTIAASTPKDANLGLTDLPSDVTKQGIGPPSDHLEQGNSPPGRPSGF